MFFLKNVTQGAREIHTYCQRRNSTAKEIVFIALLSVMAAVFQSAGGFLPGIGYLISPLATAPIVLAAVFSLRSGITAYFVTVILLFVLQPGELIIFPFTTGCLGVGIGAAFLKFEKRINIILTASAFLLTGIVLILFVLQFPVLGPAVSSSFRFTTLGSIALFSLAYSWIWVEFSIVILRTFRNKLDG